MLKPLREHQAERVVATVRELELPEDAPLPPAGLRTQVIMATGSCKTLGAVHAAEELTADRVLVLVPSLDLLEQTARAWRDGGRPSPHFGVSSLKSEEAGFPNTTDADELVRLTRVGATSQSSRPTRHWAWDSWRRPTSQVSPCGI